MPDESTRRVLRRLVPAPRGSRTVSKPNPAPPGRRKQVTAACETCRKRKTRCDGIRPQCSPCILSKRGCQYTTEPAETRSSALKRSKNHAEQQLRDVHRSHAVLLQLVCAITTSADADVAAILEQLRQGCDPALIIQRFEDGGLIHQRRERADAAKEASSSFAQDLAEQHRAGKLPPIAHWYVELGRTEDEIGGRYRYL